MSVRLDDDGTVVLAGVCPIEDAEPLLQGLLARPGATVDWRACEAAHTAVVQILLAARAELIGPPRDSFLRDHVEPALRRARQEY